MKTARNLSLLALAIAAASPAFATKCADGLDFSEHPEGRCDWYYAGTDPSRPAAAGATSASTANSGAGAFAGAGASLDSRIVVDASGAPVSAEQRQEQRQRQQQQQLVNATGGGLSGTIGVNGGSTTYNNSTKISTLILPALPMGAALPPFSASNSSATITACTTRKIVWREPVTVLVRNSFWPDHVEHVGWDESLRDDPKAPNGYILKRVPVAYGPNGEIIYRDVPHGTQALIKKELTNSASGATAGFGLGGSGGAGQLSATSQGVIQRWTTSIDVFDCPLDLAPAKVIEKANPAVVFIETDRKEGGK